MSKLVEPSLILNPINSKVMREIEKSYVMKQRSTIISGVLLITAGVLFFARKLGVEFPDWLFTWQMFLVLLGFYIAAKHNFRSPGGFILMLIGGVFMLERFYPDFRIHEFFWPTFLIAAGLLVIFKPYKKGYKFNQNNYTGATDGCFTGVDSLDQTIEVNSIMSGVKRNILSKDFKGGVVNCIMGGAELDLVHAHINGTATLEMDQILGGTKLIVPAHWDIKSEMVVILGGIEDKRPITQDFGHEQRPTLILKGHCIFGGVDIRSY
jgi:predicted membrane protein